MNTADKPVPQVLVLPVENWPEGDRALWSNALVRSRSPFRMKGGGKSLNPYTLRGRQTGWGRYLGFLTVTGKLDRSAQPIHRLSPQQLDDYVVHLRACGNSDQTILSRVTSLRMALLTMAPDADLDWVLRPRDIPLQQHFQGPMRARATFLSAALLDWAEAVFQAGLSHPKPRCRRAMVRDAAMIGILVMPAPRLNALAQFELGRNLQRAEDGWCVDQNSGITKTRQSTWCPLHPRVGEMLDRYLTVERLQLLSGRQSNRLWIAQDGDDLAKAGIVTRIKKLSRQHFGHEFCPHTFRRSLATTNATDGFDSPLDASVLLGHTSPATTTKYYNRAKTSAAAKRHADRLRRLRQARSRWLLQSICSPQKDVSD